MATFLVEGDGGRPWMEGPRRGRLVEAEGLTRA